MHKFQWYERLTWVSIVLGFVSLSFLGVYWAAHRYLASEYADSFLVLIAKELGMAGLIALILNVSIEWINRAKHFSQQNELLFELEKKHEDTSKRLLNDVNKQLFRTVYQRNIDAEVFAQVEKHLLMAEIMRRDFKASFTIKPFRMNGELTNLAVVDFCNSFTVQNLTDAPVTAPVVKALIDVKPAYRDQCKFKRIKIGETIFEGAALDEKVQQVAGRNLLTVRVDQVIAANESVPVSVEYQKLEAIDYLEVVVTTIPADKIDLEVVDPESFFTVDAMSLHPEDEVRVTNSEREFLAQWKLDNAIFPGQGILLSWHPKANRGELELTHG